MAPTLEEWGRRSSDRQNRVLVESPLNPLVNGVLSIEMRRFCERRRRTPEELKERGTANYAPLPAPTTYFQIPIPNRNPPQAPTQGAACCQKMVGAGARPAAADAAPRVTARTRRSRPRCLLASPLCAVRGNQLPRGNVHQSSAEKAA
jgi:hypothetical protein